MYTNYNHENFENILKAKDWQLFDNLYDPNLQWTFTYDNVIDILSEMCPYRVTPVRKTPTPWITPEIFNLIHEKRSLTKQYKQTHDQNLLQELRILRHNLNTKIAKSSYGSIFGKRALLAIDHIMLALFWSNVPNMK